jgi:aryl-alcohol dehydrogenase-like predicted oxidoreductase
MEKLKIEKTYLKLYPSNLGGNVFGWTVDEQQSFGILDRFVADGF